jgi:hypothetical protein
MQVALSCVTSAIWRVAESPEQNGQYILATSEDPIELRREGKAKLYLAAAQTFTYRQEEGGWRVQTLAYSYQTALNADISDELLLWHWHPAQRAGAHLHAVVEHATEGPMRRLHLPTERVAFELVLRFLIEELGVQPHRKDWSHQLTEGEDYFRLHRSWPGPHPEPSEATLLEHLRDSVARRATALRKRDRPRRG